MRAWRFHQAGNIENLVLEEAPDPEPGPGEALVRIASAALNPADRYLVQGQYPRAGAPPFTPGRDGAGVVAKAPLKLPTGVRAALTMTTSSDMDISCC